MPSNAILPARLFSALAILIGAVIVACAADSPTNPPPVNPPPVNPPPASPPADPTLQTATVNEGFRGQQVILTGSNFSNPKEISAIRFGKALVDLNTITVTPEILAEPKKPSTLTFRIPENAELGKQILQVDFQVGETKRIVPVRVTAANQKQFFSVLTDQFERLNLDSIAPGFVYPNDHGGNSTPTYVFRLLGQGFSMRGADNQLEIENQRSLRVNWQSAGKDATAEVDAGTNGGGNESASADSKISKYDATGEVISSRELQITLLNKEILRSPAKLRVRLGDVVSNAVPITFVAVNEGFPRAASLGLLVCILALVGWIMYKGSSPQSGSPEVRVGFVASFFLDKETDTFSLSKLQFYLWTFAAIFGYAYLALCRSLVQGVFELPNIPVGLPGIIGAAAATSILATGITSARGPKGAGAVHPSFSDFFTSGGVVSVDRFQFFVWTILGVVSFITMLILRDPSTLKDLPAIPQGFLLLMGMSSAGYLGGKFVAKPGPIIDSIIATRGSLKLEVHGRNISKDASYRIEDQDITYKLESNNNQSTAADETPKDATVKVIAKEDGANAEIYLKSLLLTIASPDPEWLKGEKKLTVINADGQTAIWPFALAKPIVQKFALGANNSITISGKNFGVSNAGNTVSVKGAPAFVGGAAGVQWTDTSITLPAGEVPQKGETVPVEFTIDGQKYPFSVVVS